MKFIACADLHITDKMPYSDDKNDRQNELLNAWKEVCDCAREHGSNTILIAGDVFDDINISPKAFDIFSAMLDISKGMTKIVISGNHETDESGGAFVKTLAHIPSIDTGIISPSSKISGWRIVSLYNVDLVIFDFYNSFTNLLIGIREALKKTNPNKIKIMVGHQSVVGMEMRNSTICTQGIPQNWFNRKGIIGENFDLVLMGDFHKAQKLKSDVEGYYLGSLIQHSFRDEGTTPSFRLIDIQENKISTKQININCPKFHTIQFIEGKLEPNLDVISKNGYIRVTIVGTQSYIDSKPTNKLKELIELKCKPKKLMISNPTVTCSVPTLETVAVSRLMNNEELIEKIISTDNNKLPTKLLYYVGIKYLKRSQQYK